MSSTGGPLTVVSSPEVLEAARRCGEAVPVGLLLRRPSGSPVGTGVRSESTDRPGFRDPLRFRLTDPPGFGIGPEPTDPRGFVGGTGLTNPPGIVEVLGLTDPSRVA